VTRDCIEVIFGDGIRVKERGEGESGRRREWRCEGVSESEGSEAGLGTKG